jgi:hypothetical protein
LLYERYFQNKRFGIFRYHPAEHFSRDVFLVFHVWLGRCCAGRCAERLAS